MVPYMSIRRPKCIQVSSKDNEMDLKGTEFEARSLFDYMQTFGALSKSFWRVSIHV